jgi:hypothetical protein
MSGARSVEAQSIHRSALGAPAQVLGTERAHAVALG